MPRTFFEYAIEISQIIKSGFVASVENMTGFVQTPAGILDALYIEVMAKRISGDLLKQISESTRR